MSEQRYFDIPGNDTFVLPDLLVTTEVTAARATLEQAEEYCLDQQRDGPDQFIFLPRVLGAMRGRTWEIHLAWEIGEDVFTWIRDCQWFFKNHVELGGFFDEGVWPHYKRIHLVELVIEKKLLSKELLQSAMGLRLVFRKRPMLENFSDQCLMTFAPDLFRRTYQEWLNCEPTPTFRLPPKRFDVKRRPKEIVLGKVLESLHS